jgi:hypothetical protein
MIALMRLLMVAAFSLASFTDATEPSTVEALIAPPRVSLGMQVSALKAARPEAFDGPEASKPNDPQQRRWPTVMEVIDLGNPSQISFWYLFANNKLVGLLKTRNLVLETPERRNIEAVSAYLSISEFLGVPSQESFLRKGDTSFVSVRADVWTDEVSKRKFYFIATTKEITTAVIAQSDFPMEQVLIRPNPGRFQLEDKATQSVEDLPRPPYQNGDAASTIRRSPTPPVPLVQNPTQAKIVTLIGTTPEAERTDDGLWFAPWVLIIVLTLGALVKSWRTAAKHK